MKKKILWMSLTVALMLFGFCLCVAADNEVIEAVTEAADTADSYADMGGLFSSERLAMAGEMILKGMGLVFLCLAILWGVLVIFKKIMYDTPMKKQMQTIKDKSVNEIVPDDDEVPMGLPEQPAEDDGAIVAAITAAIAAAIEADETLNQQFAGGFRVVSFKKKDGCTMRNR